MQSFLLFICLSIYMQNNSNSCGQIHAKEPGPCHNGMA